MERRTPTAVRRGRRVREKAAAATAGEGVAAVATGLDRRRPRESRYDTANTISTRACRFLQHASQVHKQSTATEVDRPMSRHRGTASVVAMSNGLTKSHPKAIHFFSFALALAVPPPCSPVCLCRPFGFVVGLVRFGARTPVPRGSSRWTARYEARRPNSARWVWRVHVTARGRGALAKTRYLLRVLCVSWAFFWWWGKAFAYSQDGKGCRFA